jgi:hypothetical protein
MFIFRASGSLAISEALWPGDPWLCVPRLPVVCLCQRHPTLCRLPMEEVAKSGTSLPAPPPHLHSALV